MMVYTFSFCCCHLLELVVLCLLISTLLSMSTVNVVAKDIFANLNEVSSPPEDLLTVDLASSGYYDMLATVSRVRPLLAVCLPRESEDCRSQEQKGIICIPTAKTDIEDYIYKDSNINKVSLKDCQQLVTIGDYAFFMNQISTLILPPTVISIGEKAFAENQLKSLSLPSTVTVIEDGAFAWNKLSAVNIPRNVYRIGNWAFRDNDIQSIDIPQSVKTVGEYAFSWNNIESITIPTSIKVLPAGIFFNNKIVDVSIPIYATSIDDYAFSENSIARLKIPASVTSIGKHAFQYNKISNRCCDANSYLFEGKSSKVMTFYNGLQSIGGWAFANNDIQAVRFPSSVTYIGMNAFLNNPILSACYETRRPSSSSKQTYLSDNEMGFRVPFTRCVPECEDKNSNEGSGCNGPYTVKIATSLTFVNARAFYQAGIIGVDFTGSNYLTVIRESAFSDNNISTQFNCRNCVVLTVIDNSAFSYNSIPSILLPPFLEKIGDDAFARNLISTLVLPSSITNIGKDAFADNPLISACYMRTFPFFSVRDPTYYGINIPLNKCP